MDSSKYTAHIQNANSMPEEICKHCRGMGECTMCHNDAFCTKCAKNPKRTAGSDVKYIIKTNSFVKASEMNTMEPCNQSLINAEGGISHTASKPKAGNRPYRLARSSLINVSTFGNSYRLEDYYQTSKAGGLGKGSYGTVSKVRCNFTHNNRALKTVLKSKIENITRLKREILIMKRLDHPGIIRLHEVFEDEVNLYFVMELCTGGELFDRVIKAQRFSEQYSARLIKQVLSVLCYIHSNNIIHRDLKPENLLYIDASPDSNIKVIDWGFVIKCTHDHLISSVVGTPYYVAPEVLLGKYGVECDIWSTGVILYIMLCGYPPFYGADNKEILKKVKSGVFSLEGKYWCNRSDEVKNVLQGMLNINRKERITAKQALQHNWMRFFCDSTRDEKTLRKEHGEELLKRFRCFVQMNPIKRLAVTATAYMLSHKELKSLPSLFNFFDRNGDGVLTATEIREALMRLQVIVPNDFDDIMCIMDSDRNGTIDYTEFLAATLDPNQYSHEKSARNAFRIFDMRMTGHITTNQIMRSLEVNVGDHTFTAERVELFMNEYTDTPGCLTLENFIDLLAETKGQPAQSSKTQRSLPEARFPSANQSQVMQTGYSTAVRDSIDQPCYPATLQEKTRSNNAYTSNDRREENGRTSKIRSSPLVTTYNKAKILLRNRSTKHLSDHQTATNQEQLK